METAKTKIIRQLNDRLRQDDQGGVMVCTPRVHNLAKDDFLALLELVRGFSDFTEENDPRGEHDFGSVTHNNKKYFWKIDYYDVTMSKGSEDPSDPTLTTRVLTIMEAMEY